MGKLITAGTLAGTILFLADGSRIDASLQDRLADIGANVESRVMEDMVVMDQMKEQAEVPELSQDEVDALVTFLRSPPATVHYAVDVMDWEPDPIILRTT